MEKIKIRELSEAELQQKEVELYQEIVNLRVQATLGQMENPLRLRYTRRQLAKVKTILRENEIIQEKKQA